MQPRTHLAIDRRLCGEPLDPGETAAGTARVGLTTVPEMAADAAGLVHGGFVFGLADHAAMLAVNHPNVVLGSAAVRFLRPVAVGERLVAEATVAETAGRRSRVLVAVRRAAAGGADAGSAGASGGERGSGGSGGADDVGSAGGASGAGGVDGAGGAGVAAGETVMSGELVCFTLDRHVLEPAGEAGEERGDGRRAEPRPGAGA